MSSKIRFLKLFESVAFDSSNLQPAYRFSIGAQNAGVQLFTKQYNNGEVWVHLQNEIIRNAGVNPI